MEGYHPKGPDTSKGLTPPNCSYITRCKELTKTEHANWIGLTNQDAIAGVLSELEKKDIEIEVLKRQVDVDNIILEKKDKEAETWKKIAEKLAEDSIAIVKLAVKKENYNPPTKQELLDWAKSEVENDKQS